MNKKILFGLIGAIVATGAWATDDGHILTTQTYVDNALGSKVDIAQGTGDNDENVGKTLVVNQQGDLELGTVSADNFVEDSITDGVTNKAPSENAVHDALENKQNTIATDMVDFTEPEEQIDYELPSLVTYDSANGVNGTRIGLVDLDNGGGGIGFLATDINPRDSVNAVYDNYVPTFRTVAAGLEYIWDAMPNRLNWYSSLQTPINNYSTTFSSASNTWPNDTQNYVPTAQTLAHGLALKQNKIPAGTVGKLVTYTGIAGTVGSVATANAPTYNATTGALTNGTSIATIAAVDTKQNKMTCTRWLDTPEHPEHNDDNCLLWDLGN